MSFGVACLYGAAFLLLLELPSIAIGLICNLVGACVRADRRPRFARQLRIGTVTAAAAVHDPSDASLFSGFDRWIHNPGARRRDFQPD